MISEIIQSVPLIFTLFLPSSLDIAFGSRWQIVRKSKLLIQSSKDILNK